MSLDAVWHVYGPFLQNFLASCSFDNKNFDQALEFQRNMSASFCVLKKTSAKAKFMVEIKFPVGILVGFGSKMAAPSGRSHVGLDVASSRLGWVRRSCNSVDGEIGDGPSCARAVC